MCPPRLSTHTAHTAHPLWANLVGKKIFLRMGAASSQSRVYAWSTPETCSLTLAERLGSINNSCRAPREQGVVLVGRVRQVAPFSAILSNLDKPKYTGHVHEVFYAFPTPLDTPGGHPGVPRSGPGVPGSQLDFPRGTPRSIKRRRKRVEHLMYMTCALGFVQIRQNGQE